MENKIETQNAGYRCVLKFLLSKGIRILETNEMNNARYNVCKTSEGNFLVIFKRDMFHNFGKEFREEGATGMGESVNREDLRYAVSQLGVTKLFFIYPNIHIYSISVEDFLSNSFMRENKEGKETLSMSIHKLKRENPERDE